MTQELNTDLVRFKFPALASGYTFFDNAGGSQTLGTVADRIRDYLLNTNVQLGASYRISQESGERVDVATRAMTQYINAPSSDEVIMGPSTTALLKILSISLARTWSEGDEIIVTNTDHEANVSPWTALQDQGFTVKIWKANPDTLRLELDDLRALLNGRTRLVAVTHASNILGTINPIKEITRVVHEHGAQICVDGVAYAPHRAIDVQEWDVDYYVFSFYKVYGPHYAMLYARKELFDRLPSHNHYFINEGPYKFQPGNVNFELAHGMGAVPEYLAMLATRHGYPTTDLRTGIVNGFKLIADHEEKLAKHFLDFLNSKSNVRIIGETTHDQSVRVPTISFVVDDKQSESFCLACDPHEIGIRFGDFYAVKLIQDADLERFGGVTRVSMVHYNTIDEVDRLIKILDPLI